MPLNLINAIKKSCANFPPPPPPQGERVAVGTHKGLVQVWDVSSNKRLQVLDGHGARVGALAWNGDTVSSGSRCVERILPWHYLSWKTLLLFTIILKIAVILYHYLKNRCYYLPLSWKSLLFSTIILKIAVILYHYLENRCYSLLLSRKSLLLFTIILKIAVTFFTIILKIAVILYHYLENRCYSLPLSWKLLLHSLPCAIIFRTSVKLL